MRALIPVFVLLITFVLTAGVIAWSGANPFEVYRYLLLDPLSSQVGALEVLVKATPLILCGVAVSFAFSAGYYSIGVEGQLYAGAITAAWLGTVLGALPSLLALPLMLLGGFAAGLLWALVPALLRVKLAVDEVVTTLLLNPVMVFILDALLGGPWRDPRTSQLQSPEIALSTRLPRLVPRSRLHLGLLIALAAAAVLWFVLSRTGFGLKLRAAGLERDAARFLGVKVDRVMLTCALVSGGVAGIAGVCEIAGIHYHIIPGFSAGYGYSGVIVAMLGGLNPLGVVFAGLFFGLIDTGAQTVARSVGVPVYLGQVIQATMLLVTLALLLLQKYRIRRI
jgi:simple sugar transport system permease protein